MKVVEIHVHVHDDVDLESDPTPYRLVLNNLNFLHSSMSSTIESLTRALAGGRAQPQVRKFSMSLKEIVQAVIEKWNELKAVVDQAEAALNAVPQRIADAVAAAEAAGAPPETLAALNQLVADMGTENAELKTAIASQTPPAGVPDVPVDPPGPDNGPEEASAAAAGAAPIPIA